MRLLLFLRVVSVLTEKNMQPNFRILGSQINSHIRSQTNAIRLTLKFPTQAKMFSLLKEHKSHAPVNLSELKLSSAHTRPFTIDILYLTTKVNMYTATTITATTTYVHYKV